MPLVGVNTVDPSTLYWMIPIGYDVPVMMDKQVAARSGHLLYDF